MKAWDCVWYDVCIQESYEKSFVYMQVINHLRLLQETWSESPACNSTVSGHSDSREDKSGCKGEYKSKLSNDDSIPFQLKVLEYPNSDVPIPGPYIVQPW